jgi:hypothetical protein
LILPQQQRALLAIANTVRAAWRAPRSGRGKKEMKTEEEKEKQRLAVIARRRRRRTPSQEQENQEQRSASEDVQACPLSVPSAFPVRQPTSCWPLRRPSCGLAERAHAPIARLPLQPEGESLEWRSSTALEAVPVPEGHPTNPAAHPCVCPHSPRRGLAHTAGRAGAGAARGLLLHGAGLAGRRISGVSGVFDVGRTGALGWTSRGGGSGGGGMMPGSEVLRGTCVGSGFSSCSR